MQGIARASIAEAVRRAAAAPRRTKGSVVERIGREIATRRDASDSLDHTFVVVDVPGTWSRTLVPQVTLVGAQACADEATGRVLLSA